MDQLKYNSFAVFCTTLGLVLLISPALIARHYDSQLDTVILEQAKYDSLTAQSQAIVDERADRYVHSLDTLLDLQGVFFVLGLFTFCYGANSWKTVSDVEFKQKTLQADETALRIKKMLASDSEIVEKKEQEIWGEDSEKGEDSENVATPLQPVIETTPTTSADGSESQNLSPDSRDLMKLRIDTALDIENKVMTRLQELLRNQYQVSTYVWSNRSSRGITTGQVLFDGVAFPESPYDNAVPMYIEIKICAKRLNVAYVNRQLDRSYYKFRSLARTDDVGAIVIVVVEDNVLSDEDMQSMANTIDISGMRNKQRLIKQVIRMSEIDSFVVPELQ